MRTKSGKSFTETEFENWKKALEKNSGLARHNDSNSQKKASEDSMKAQVYDTKNTDELLDNQATTTT